MELWPNFFIVGAPKAGTTSLYEYLKNIPDIYMSPKKEPQYFSIKAMPDKKPFKPIRNKEKYLDLFKNATNEVIFGEASTLYLSDPEASTLIRKACHTARILISLRDPVERLFSHYLMNVSRNWIKSSFKNQIHKEMNNKADFTKPHIRLSASLYSKDVQRYLDTFGKEHVKILIFEEFIKNPKVILEDILKFLGVKNIINNFEDVKVHNPYFKIESSGEISKQILQSNIISKISVKILPSFGRRFFRKKILTRKNTKKPVMKEADRQYLIDFYKSDVKKLEVLIGRKFPWKNFYEVN